MRKLIISILLASAASSPALAQDHGRWHQDDAQSSDQQSHEDRSRAREQRQEVREQVRAERFSGGANAERMQQVQQQQVQQQQAQQQQAQQQQAQQQAARQFEGRQQWQRQGGGWDRSRFEGQRTVTPQQVVDQQQAARNYRGYRGGFAGQVQQDQAQREGSWARNRGSWSQDRDGDFRQREAQQQRMRQGERWASGGWNRDWRNDRRYDWHNYRDRHRSVFRLGIYFDPFGYGYRSFNIGYNLAPLYFGQQYWIDPAMYQLPYPPPGTVWVRYWNDAVLVDTYSGEVVDVIHNFFW